LKRSYASDLYLALIHYPVTNKNGDIIASAVTNLDLHDISRAARTYAVKRVYVVTPLSDQKELVKKIVSHWVEGAGSTYNSIRGEALALIKLMDSLEDVVGDIRKKSKAVPRTVVTSAKKNARGIGRTIGYQTFQERLASGAPHLLLFGTAWGLSESVIDEADFILDPIMGEADYNHLSVRSAVSIILDRLKGDYK